MSTAPDMTFVAATPDDARRIWQWRTDARTVPRFFDRTPIPWEAHRQWFARALVNPDDLVLLAHNGARAVGVMRFTRFTVEQARMAQVGLYLDPDVHGQGLGPRMLNSFVQGWVPQYGAVETVLGKVAFDNRASQVCFERAGFQRADFAVPGPTCIREIGQQLIALRTGGPVSPPQGCPDHHVYTLSCAQNIRFTSHTAPSR